MSAFPLHYTRKISRLAALGLFLISVQIARADNSKISPDLLPLLQQPSNSINVIVQYNSQPSGGGGLLGPVFNLLDGLVNIVFSLIPAVAAILHPADVISLSNQPNVAYISLDRPLAASLDYSAGAVNAPAAWSAGLDGSGVGIAIIDSGIYSHPDLNGVNSGQSRVVYRQSFIGGNQFDDFGHGTHVAGIAAGNGADSSKTGAFHTYRGIAPNANVLDLRVLDANGSSSDSVVIAAIQKAVQLKNRYNVRVINLSLGRPIYEGCTHDPLCQAVEAAWKNGIVVVVAAGNLGRNGYGTILSPGDSPHAITVGCMKTEMTVTRADDLIASYSSKGPTYIDLTAKPDLVAPGNLVVSLLAPGSTLEAEYPGNVIPPSQYTTSSSVGAPAYFRLSGTSMATPVVSGAVALLLQRNPNLTPDTIKARLMKTASKNFPATSTAYDPTTGQSYTDVYDMFTVGAGYMDIAAALANNDSVFTSAASPQMYYNQAQQTAYLVPNFLSTWWLGSTWSPQVVWGSTVLKPGSTGSPAVWDSAVAWGTSGQWGTAVAWGTGGTSGTAVAWGTSGQGEQ
ncbi:MAG TPA: S8 family peptidase [Bryobacteraceae bacterium]|jgi:serine protease AprX|nr:S8 family peptidase [Bryobacteraceae bacterium]